MPTLCLLAVTCRTATFELQNHHAYAPQAPLPLFLNGKALMPVSQNVFTLYDLSPKMYYTVRVGEGEPLAFVTSAETLCLDVTAFGAVGDGRTDCTGALQAAIAACPKGGTLYVPPGTYVTYPLFLKSDLTLYLQKGATLLAGTQRARYPVLPGMVQPTAQAEVNYGTWEGNPLDCYASLLTMIEADNVVVAGEGTLDGNAVQADWWQNPKQRRGAWRPRTVYACRCNHLRLVGVTVQNSPSWTVHPYYCTEVDVLNVIIRNPSDSPNTDGCNPESCHNVRIIGAFISVGDDCIAVKSGKRYMAHHHHRATRNLLIRNCLMERGHGAVVVGSEVAGGVENLRVERCLMRNTDRGLRVKTRRGRGSKSVLTGIVFCDIIMEGVKTPFVINMFYFCDPDGHTPYVASKTPLPVDERTPQIGTLLCNNVVCSGCEVAGAFLYGLPEMPIDCVTLQNVAISFRADAEKGMPAMMEDIAPMAGVALLAANVRKLTLENVSFTGYQGEALHLENIETLERTTP